MARKIISVQKTDHAQKVNGAGVVIERVHMLTALCDDGTVWQKIGSTNWMRVEDIPQDAP